MTFSLNLEYSFILFLGLTNENCLLWCLPTKGINTREVTSVTCLQVLFIAA